MNELFSKIGLNDNEREVYLSILKAGKIPPHRVAKETDINRTTVYSIARKLEKLGLITEDVGQKISYFVAESPGKIKTIFEKDQKALDEKREATERLAIELERLPSNPNYSIPHIKFVEETDLNDYLYERYPVWRDHLTAFDNTWWGYQDSTFSEKYRKFIEWSWKQGPEDLKVKFLTNKAEIEKDLIKKFNERKTKVLPSNMVFDSSLWVIGDYIVMAQTRIKPHYLVEIHDAVFARNQRELFKGLWQLA